MVCWCFKGDRQKNIEHCKVLPKDAVKDLRKLACSMHTVHSTHLKAQAERPPVNFRLVYLDASWARGASQQASLLLAGPSIPSARRHFSAQKRSVFFAQHRSRHVIEKTSAPEGSPFSIGIGAMAGETAQKCAACGASEQVKRLGDERGRLFALTCFWW